MTFKLNKRAAWPAQTPAAIAWCAGFFDGDGCTTISKQQIRGRKNLTYRLRIVLTQNDLETLWHYQAVMGEQSFVTKMSDRPNVNRAVYMLVYEGRHALAALNKMLPHLVRKRAGADAANRFWIEGEMGKRPGPMGLPSSAWAAREHWFQRLRRLAGR